MKKLLLATAMIASITATIAVASAQEVDDNFRMVAPFKGGVSHILMPDGLTIPVQEHRKKGKVTIFVVHYDVDDEYCGKLFNFPQTDTAVLFLCELD